MTSDDHLPRLPSEFQDAFELAKAKANLTYATRADAFPHHPQFAEPTLHRLIRIQEEFFAYCTQARSACRAGMWTVAEVSRAVDAAWQVIFDSSFDRELGGSSEEARRLRAATWRTVEDDRRWRQHLSELVTLAESHSTGGSPPQPHPDTAQGILPGNEQRTSEARPGGHRNKEFSSYTPDLATQITTIDGQAQPPAIGWKAIVDGFLYRCNLEPGLTEEIIREHIWRSIGHKKPRQFQYWQANDARATKADKRNFPRIVQLEPAEFVKLLRKKDLIRPKS